MDSIEFINLTAVMVIALIIPLLASLVPKAVRVPAVVLEILAGIVFGPSGLGSPVRFARRVPLEPDPRAAARARDEIAAAVRAWDVPVDLDVAVLLASELVTNAVIHGMEDQPGPVTITLAIAADATGLRVDVHDASACLPVIRPVGEDVETGRGLLLVSSLSDEWGYYRTPPGKAVYFTLKPAT